MGLQLYFHPSASSEHCHSDGWQLVDITITTLRSIQAVAETLLAWTVCESPLQVQFYVY